MTTTEKQREKERERCWEINGLRERERRRGQKGYSQKAEIKNDLKIERIMGRAATKRVNVDAAAGTERPTTKKRDTE